MAKGIVQRVFGLGARLCKAGLLVLSFFSWVAG